MTRLYAYAGALLAALTLGFSGGWTVNGWRHEAAQKAAVEAVRAAETAARQQVIDRLKSDIRTAQESSNAYQSELARLRDNPVPIPPVRRVCPPASSPAPDLPGARTTASGSTDRAATGGVVSQPHENDPGRDIGPELASLADEADRCSAQLRGLIRWVRSTR